MWPLQCMRLLIIWMCASLKDWLITIVYIPFELRYHYMNRSLPRITKKISFQSWTRFITPETPLNLVLIHTVWIESLYPSLLPSSSRVSARASLRKLSVCRMSGSLAFPSNWPYVCTILTPFHDITYHTHTLHLYAKLVLLSIEGLAFWQVPPFDYLYRYLKI